MRRELVKAGRYRLRVSTSKGNFISDAQSSRFDEFLVFCPWAVSEGENVKAICEMDAWERGINLIWEREFKRNTNKSAPLSRRNRKCRMSPMAHLCGTRGTGMTTR